jgi:TgpA N-terminal domain/Transglutaminase-like superfamily
MKWTSMVAGGLPAVAATVAAVLYDSPLLMLVVVLAAAVAGAGPVALTGFRRTGTGVGPLAVLALLALLAALLLLANGGTPPADGIRELGGALARLLSFEPPIPTRLDTLVPPVIVVWAASFAAAALAARGPRLLAVVPSVLVLVMALLLVGRAAPAPGWVAPVIGLGAAGLALGGTAGRGAGGQGGRTGPTGRRIRTGRVLGALAAVLVIAVGVLVSAAVPDQHRADARAHYRPPEERPEPIDPLTRLSGWAKGDTEVLARVRIDSPAAGAASSGPTATQTNWRWAVLDHFDGARWTSSLRYRPTGKRLRASLSSATDLPARPLRAGLQVSPTLSPWLPTPGVVHQVTGLGVSVNPDHDSIVQASPSQQSQTYGLEADSGTLDPTASADRAVIAGFRVGAAGGVDDERAVPRLPQSLRTIAQAFQQDKGSTDGERALHLQDVLRQGQFVPDAPPGHLYVRLVQFFDDSSNAYLKGTSEQFATAFAVLARRVGLPTRIVVGFTVPAEPAGSAGSARSAQSAGDVDVTGTNMKAWPEVYFSGHGWVRFAPTPTNRGTSTAKNPPKLRDLIPQAQRPATPTPATIKGAGGKAGKQPAPKPAGGVSVLAVFGTALLAVLLLSVLAMLAAVVLRLRLRNARRHGPDPAGRAIGAWRELEDAVVLAGAGSRSGSATALVERVERRTIADSRAPTDANELTELAAIANAAAFGPSELIDAQQADRAWRISEAATGALRRTAARSRRWRWWLRPGPLLRRR